jgi:hypothetical protein
LPQRNFLVKHKTYVSLFFLLLQVMVDFEHVSAVSFWEISEVWYSKTSNPSPLFSLSLFSFSRLSRTLMSVAPYEAQNVWVLLLILLRASYSQRPNSGALIPFQCTFFVTVFVMRSPLPPLIFFSLHTCDLMENHSTL